MKSCRDCALCAEINNKDICIQDKSNLYQEQVTEDTPICQFFTPYTKPFCCSDCVYCEKIGMARNQEPVYQCLSVGGQFSECVFTRPEETTICNKFRGEI